MDQKDLNINNLIMREIGLEIGVGNRIIDQDTGAAVTFGGKEIVAPGIYGGHNAIEFDPHNNKKMMNRLFGYFLEKHADESDVSVMTYYNVDKPNNLSSIECKMTDSSVIVSKPYARESLRCADIIIQLNGGESPDLYEYDTEKEINIKKRSGTNVKNKSNSKTTKNRK